MRSPRTRMHDVRWSRSSGFKLGRALHDLEQATPGTTLALDVRGPLDESEGILRRGGVLAAVSALGIAAVLALALSSVFGSGSGGLSTISSNAVGVIDPESNTLVAEVPVGVGPVRCPSAMDRFGW